MAWVQVLESDSFQTRVELILLQQITQGVALGSMICREAKHGHYLQNRIPQKEAKKNMLSFYHLTGLVFISGGPTYICGEK